MCHLSTETTSARDTETSALPAVFLKQETLGLKPCGHRCKWWSGLRALFYYSKKGCIFCVSHLFHISGAPNSARCCLVYISFGGHHIESQHHNWSINSSITWKMGSSTTEGMIRCEGGGTSFRMINRTAQDKQRRDLNNKGTLSIIHQMKVVRWTDAAPSYEKLVPLHRCRVCVERGMMMQLWKQGKQQWH